jgi:uncharacterized protein YggE
MIHFHGQLFRCQIILNILGALTMFSKKHTIKHISLLTLLAAILALVVTACTPSANAGGGNPAAVTTQSSQNGITVIGMGEAVGQPDEAHITVGVETFAKVVNDATTENEATIQAILSALDKQGIALEDIQTSNYSLWAEQLYGDNGPEGIAGYRISNQVNVTIRDIEKVGDVLTATINAGANSIYGVTFSVADPAALEAEARETAIADARQRAESLAQLSGVELGAVQVITETFTQMPFPMMGFGGGGGDMMQPATVTSISPGQLSYQVQVQVTFAMK